MSPFLLSSRHIAKTGLLICTSLMLSQCDNGPGARIKGLREEIEALNHQKYEKQQQINRLQSQIDASRAEKKKLEEEKTKAEDERETTQKQLEQIKRDFDNYKNQYKLSMQKREPGLPLTDFVSSDGKSYQHVVLREITESQVNFTHDGGIMKLHYKQLPENLQAMLGFLIEPPKAAHEVKTMSNRQINTQRRTERDNAINEAEQKLRGLRDQRVNSMRQQNQLNLAIIRAESQGAPMMKLKREAEQLDLYIKQVSNQILQAEVDVHRARQEPVKLLPEK